MKVLISLLAILVLMVNTGHAITLDEHQNHNSQQIQGMPLYTIKKYSIDTGGGKLTGGAFQLTSSIGQLDGDHQATGGLFSFKGGFHSSKTSDLIFKNGFE